MIRTGVRPERYRWWHIPAVSAFVLIAKVIFRTFGP